MRIAINGFGRIGRIFFRQACLSGNGGSHIEGERDLEIVAINDLADKDNLIYLAENDSVYGKFNFPRDEIKFLNEKDPANLPWKEMGVDVVVESTGFFASYEKAKAHLDAGAKRVVISAPAKDEITGTMTPNVGVEAAVKSKITSNASCTTNAATPVVSIMMKNPGIKKAILNTVHGYTATQGLVDKPNAKDWRRGRAAALNIVPSTTGAALATAKAIPEMRDKFDGAAMRVPVLSGSIIDFTFVSERPVTAEEINGIFREAAGKPEWEGIIKVADKPLVSTDILGEPFGSVIDPDFTRVVGGDLVKIFSWYDNEWGYAAMLLKHVQSLKEFL